MIDWLAMMVAMVASTTRGIRSTLKNDGRLTRVIQNKAGKDDKIPRSPNGYLAEVAHVGIERLCPCHAQKHAAKHEKVFGASACQVVDAVERIYRGRHARMSRYSENPEHGHGPEPQKHDRAERAPNFSGAERLHGKEREQDDDRCRQYISLKAWRDLFHPLERRQYGDCRGDGAVAVDQGRAE
jgi:hypothetical protein